MELRQLRYFMAVADAQSITAAARKIHVVQSALSHQIANLEDDLGSPLFTRGPRGVELTQAGATLYRHAQAVVKHLDAARADVRAMGSMVTGKVAVGIPHSTAAVIAAPLLQAVCSALPSVDFSLIEGLSSDLAHELEMGRLDLAILFDPLSRRGLQGTPLLHEKLHFVTCNHQAYKGPAQRGRISLVEATTQPLLLPPPSNGVRALVDREVMRQGITLQVKAEVTGVSTTLAGVRAGLANTVMMAQNASTPNPTSDLLVLPITDPEIERSASLIQMQNFTQTTAVQHVSTTIIQLVRELLASEQWRGARAA